MKPYRPKLQAVLTLRQRAEQSALEQYAQTLLARQHAFEQLRQAEKELAQSWTDLRLQLSNGSKAADIAQQRAFSQILEERETQCQRRLAACELSVNQTLQKMLLARQQREAIEKFQARHKRYHEREVSRDEQKWLDDLASRRGAPAFSWSLPEHPFN